MRVTSYLRDAAYAEEHQNARVATLHSRIVPTTAIVVRTLVSDWLVEIEVAPAAYTSELLDRPLPSDTEDRPSAFGAPPHLNGGR